MTPAATPPHEVSFPLRNLTLFVAGETVAGRTVRRRRHGSLPPVTQRTLLSRTGRNEQAALEALLDAVAEHGTPGLVIDQPGSIAALALAVARQRDVAVAYIPGLVMRRAADLYPGEVKTDPRDSYVLADTARVHYSRIAAVGAANQAYKTAAERYQARWHDVTCWRQSEPSS